MDFAQSFANICNQRGLPGLALWKQEISQINLCNMALKAPSPSNVCCKYDKNNLEFLLLEACGAH